MKLTKQQDALATRLRDAGIPGEFAVLVASREVFRHNVSAINAVNNFLWRVSHEGFDFWQSFDAAWFAECNARGIK